MSARIYPAVPPLDTPTSELQLYRMFQNCPEMNNWTVIHSSSHQGDHSAREIDFVALIPNYGILCIEVKGGGFYIRHGQWHRWRDGAPVESPTRQSEQAMYALQKELSQTYGPNSILAQTPAECCVVFIDTEWPEHVRRPRPGVIDRCDIVGGQFYAKIMASVLRMRPRTGRRSNLPPTTPDILNQLREYLVPDFDLAPRSDALHQYQSACLHPMRSSSPWSPGPRRMRLGAIVEDLAMPA